MRRESTPRLRQQMITPESQNRPRGLAIELQSVHQDSGAPSRHQIHQLVTRGPRICEFKFRGNLVKGGDPADQERAKSIVAHQFISYRGQKDRGWAGHLDSETRMTRPPRGAISCRSMRFVVLCLCFAPAWAQPVMNRAPLAPNAFEILPLGSVKPKGWLLRQLRIQAEGQTGHLDEFWPSLSAKDSAWRGGDGEGWERGPYYLDGLVPAAYLLEDPRLIEKAKAWIEWTLSNQRPDGAIGPPKNEDWWPNMIMLKALIEFQEATGDKRVVPLMERYLLHHLANAEARPLRAWAIYRWADEIIPIIWTYNRTGNPKLLELARILARQGYDWRHHFEHFIYPFKVTRTESGLPSHVVNNAMAIKTSTVWSVISKSPQDRTAIDRLFEVMDRHHLMPQGVHAGDEHYAGNSPNQGTELCAVVEAMYSLEHVIAITGRPQFADRLERMTYNALPATFSADMWTHQYDQQPNQVLCSRDKREWTTNGPDSNLFGLEPNFGCCTANFHQGWPKFIKSMWMAAPGGGLAAVAYGPSEVKTAVAGGVNVTIKEETEYPFRDTVRLAVSPERPVAFPLHLRIPSWAEGAVVLVNEKPSAAPVKPGAFVTLRQTWQQGDRVTLKFPMPVRSSRWFNNSLAVERGPLVFALKIGEDWRKLKDYGYKGAADYEVRPSTPWNYALNGIEGAEIAEHPLSEYPFSPNSAPVSIKVQARRLPGWGMANGSAAPPPPSPVTSSMPLETIELIPYGAAKLRITVFPVLAR